MENNNRGARRGRGRGGRGARGARGGRGRKGTSSTRGDRRNANDEIEYHPPVRTDMKVKVQTEYVRQMGKKLLQ